MADKGKIEAALRAAVRKALVLHKQAGNPIAVWRDGKVEWIDVEQLGLRGLGGLPGRETEVGTRNSAPG